MNLNSKQRDFEHLLFNRGNSARVLRFGALQQEVSEIESKEELSDEVLLRLLSPLGVTLDMFNEMDESAVSGMSFYAYDHGVSGFHNTNHFHPLEELLKAKEEIKNLYERRLEAEKEEVAFLQRQLDSSK